MEILDPEIKEILNRFKIPFSEERASERIEKRTEIRAEVSWYDSIFRFEQFRIQPIVIIGLSLLFLLISLSFLSKKRYSSPPCREIYTPEASFVFSSLASLSRLSWSDLLQDSFFSPPLESVKILDRRKEMFEEQLYKTQSLLSLHKVYPGLTLYSHLSKIVQETVRSDFLYIQQLSALSLPSSHPFSSDEISEYSVLRQKGQDLQQKIEEISDSFESDCYSLKSLTDQFDLSLNLLQSYEQDELFRVIFDIQQLKNSLFQSALIGISHIIEEDLYSRKIQEDQKALFSKMNVLSHLLDLLKEHKSERVVIILNAIYNYFLQELKMKYESKRIDVESKNIFIERGDTSLTSFLIESIIYPAENRL